MTTETQTALALPTGTDLVAMFQKPSAIDDMIARIEAEVRSHAPDLSTAKGRKAISSLAYKVAQSKSALDAAGKELNAGLRAKIDATDAERRKVRDRLDALKTEVRAPLDEWEAKEEARVEAIKDRLSALDPDRTGPHLSPDQIEAAIADVQAHIDAGGWDEYVEAAEARGITTLAKMSGDLLAARTRVAQEEELARLRAEAAEREAADRARAEKEAAEKAEAERKAREAREKEARQKAEAERLERARVEEREAAARREKEAEERHAAALREAEEKAERAAQAERDRIAEEKRREDEARAKREANTRHREKVLREITKAVTPIARADLAQAMLDGKIPHVTVRL